MAVAAGAVRRDGSLIWHGVSNADRSAIVSPFSQFPIYSITKTLTAACLLRLDQSGVLRVDDQIAKWIINCPVPLAITLSQLLRHTAGVPDYGPLREYHDAVRTTPSAPWTDDQFVSATLTKGLLFAPGAGWAYSNVGYLLLRRAIENATGRSYRQCIADHIASPLGLAQTFVAETIGDWSCCVPGFGSEVSAGGEVVDVRATYHPAWCAPGVAVSTVDDVTLFYDALFSGVLLDHPHLDQMLQLTRVPGSHPPAVTPSYGMGIMADPDGLLGPSYGHGGGGPGYSLSAAILPRAPQGRLSVAVFCSTSLGADAGRGVDELLEAAARATDPS